MAVAMAWHDARPSQSRSRSQSQTGSKRLSIFNYQASVRLSSLVFVWSSNFRNCRLGLGLELGLQHGQQLYSHAQKRPTI